MKLKDAIFEMNPGDRFDPLESFHSLLEMTKSGAIKRVDIGEFIRLSKYALSIEGEIISVESKVLTVGEYIFKADQDPGKWNKRDIEIAFKQGHQNGRLERDLELRPLVNAVKNYHYNQPTWDKIQTELKNIKPLKPCKGPVKITLR